MKKKEFVVLQKAKRCSKRVHSRFIVHYVFYWNVVNSVDVRYIFFNRSQI